MLMPPSQLNVQKFKKMDIKIIIKYSHPAINVALKR